MDSMNAYREAVERVLTVYTEIPYADGELRCEALFDREPTRPGMATRASDEGRCLRCLI